MRTIMYVMALCWTGAALAAGPLAAVEPVGALEVAAKLDGAMPTGVAVSRNGRIFVNFPRWGDAVAHTVGEVRAGRTVAFPDAAWNRATGPAARRLVSVQSVVVDARDRLWMLDTGEDGTVLPGGPKLVAVDLATDRVVRAIAIPPDVALPTTYLNDVRFDLARGKAGTAFITDSSPSGPNGIIVVDLASGRSWRRLHDHPSTRPVAGFLPVVEGRPLLRRKAGAAPAPFAVGADGIAISPDGGTLYYCPLSSRRLYAVSAAALADRSVSDAAVAATVRDLGEKPPSDGLESDDRDRVYATDYEHGAILRRDRAGAWEAVAHDPRLLWPDTLCMTPGWLYVTANQLHRQAGFQGGKDLRKRPYVVFRVKVDARPSWSGGGR